MIIVLLVWFVTGAIAVKVNDWFFHGDATTTTLILIVELALGLYLWAKNDELISDTLKDYFFISIKPWKKKVKPISKAKAEEICRKKLEACLPYVNKYLKVDNIPVLEECVFYVGFCDKYGKEFVDEVYKPILEEHKLFRDKENIVRSMRLYKDFKKKGWVD